MLYIILKQKYIGIRDLSFLNLNTVNVPKLKKEVNLYRVMYIWILVRWAIVTHLLC